MTLERFSENLERIANALETLASAKEKEAYPIVSLTVDGVVAPVSIVAETPVPPSVAPDTFAMPTDGEGLKILAQNAAAKMGDKIPAFTAWVRDEFCPKYGVKKVRDIAADKVFAAAKELVNKAKAYGAEV